VPLRRFVKITLHRVRLRRHCSSPQREDSLELGSRRKNLSAVFAVASVSVVESESAARAQARGWPAGGACQFEREDARWHGDYSVAQHHEDGGEAAEDRVWRDILFDLALLILN
jgi:hypothetical protein